MAPAEGLVEYAGPLKGWGAVVVLRLGGAYHLVLAGLDQVDVQPGRIGQDRRARRPHGSGRANRTELYFEVRKNGAPVDPALWLKGALRPDALGLCKHAGRVYLEYLGKDVMEP